MPPQHGCSSTGSASSMSRIVGGDFPDSEPGLAIRPIAFLPRAGMPETRHEKTGQTRKPQVGYRDVAATSPCGRPESPRKPVLRCRRLCDAEASKEEAVVKFSQGRRPAIRRPHIPFCRRQHDLGARRSNEDSAPLRRTSTFLQGGAQRHPDCRRRSTQHQPDWNVHRSTTTIGKLNRRFAVSIAAYTAAADFVGARNIRTFGVELLTKTSSPLDIRRERCPTSAGGKALSWGWLARRAAKPPDLSVGYKGRRRVATLVLSRSVS